MKPLQTIWRALVDLFEPYIEAEQREIKEVDEWDGAAANYDTTEDYCNACLINVNQQAGKTSPDDWTQDNCMLPVREAGDSSDVYVDKAVYAAAGGRGISAVKKPDDVSQDDWDAAVEGAANKMIQAYEQMDETAPDAIYEAAGKTPPEERAISIPQIYTMLDVKLWEGDCSLWLHDVFIDDDGAMYAIASSMGKLYRADITLTSGEVTLGEWQEVEIQHVPVSRGLTVTRQDDGRYRWSGVACTAILNRSGEIDSTDLFDSFVEGFNTQDRAIDPVELDFFHYDIFFGDTDFVARDGYTLVASGLFSDDEVGRAAAEGLMADPDYWGMSITYQPGQEPDLVDVAGVEFPVWRQGKLERIALLPRDRAAAWFTTINTRSTNMKAQVLEALKKLVGEEQANALAGQVDGINERVAGDNLIARETAASEGDTAETGDTGEAGNTEADPVNDQTPAEVQVVREIRTNQREIMATLEILATTLGEFVPDVTARLEGLETAEETRRQAYLGDLPVREPLTVVRPRQVRQETDGDTPADSSVVVNQALKAKGLA